MFSFLSATFQWRHTGRTSNHRKTCLWWHKHGETHDYSFIWILSAGSLSSRHRGAFIQVRLSACSDFHSEMFKLYSNTKRRTVSAPIDSQSLPSTCRDLREIQIRPTVSAVERSLGVFMLIRWDSVGTDLFFIFTRGFLLRSLFCSQFSFTELRLYKSDLFCYVLPPHIPRKSLSLMCATNKYHLKIIEEQDASELNRFSSV